MLLQEKGVPRKQGETRGKKCQKPPARVSQGQCELGSLSLEDFLDQMTCLMSAQEHQGTGKQHLCWWIPPSNTSCCFGGSAGE